MKKQTDYKWIDLERERKTTDNPLWWMQGVLIIAGMFLALLAITFCVYTRYALTETLNYKQMLVGVSCIYAVSTSTDLL